jgi:precorrin isomerase
MSGETIETRSFEIIDQEASRNGFTADQWPIVRRILHTTADFGLCDDVRFSSDAVQAGIAALKTGSRIFADSNMIRSGLSIARLRKVQPNYSPDHVL